MILWIHVQCPVYEDLFQKKIYLYTLYCCFLWHNESEIVLFIINYDVSIIIFYYQSNVSHSQQRVSHWRNNFLQLWIESRQLQLRIKNSGRIKPIDRISHGSNVTRRLLNVFFHVT